MMGKDLLIFWTPQIPLLLVILFVGKQLTRVLCEFFTYDKWLYVNNLLTWFLCRYNIQQHTNSCSSFSIHLLEHLMQANKTPSHSLYILYTNRENFLFLHAIYFIFKNLYSYFMDKLVGGRNCFIPLIWSPKSIFLPMPLISGR